MLKLSNVVDRRYDIKIHIDAANSGGNGNPDEDNRPRQDDETGQAILTDVCTKQKTRRAMEQISKGPGSAMFFVSDDAPDDKKVLNNKMKDAYKKKGLKIGDPGAVAIVKQEMAATFRDVRTWGAVMSTGTGLSSFNAGRITGPVQMSFGRTYDPVFIAEHCITRKCVTKEDGDNGAKTRKYST